MEMCVCCIYKYVYIYVYEQMWILAPWKECYDKPRQCIKRQRHHFANDFDQSVPFPYFAQIFFAFHLHFYLSCNNLFFYYFSCMFTFLEIVKQNMPNVAYFLLSSILKWLCKNSSILISLTMCTDKTAVTI